MAKAYRTDVVVQKKFEEEIRRLKNAQPERVQCPLADCQCTYEMYGCMPSNREGNIAILEERLKREHPIHTSELFVGESISQNAEVKQNVLISALIAAIVVFAD